MLFPTHIVAGIATGLIMADNASPEKVAIFTCVSGAAALLPDTNSRESFIGTQVPFTPSLIDVAFEHRGATHSILAGLFGALIILIMAELAGWEQPAALSFAFLLGYISHLILDILNPAGVPLLWPLPVRFVIPIMHTGGMLEKLLVFPVISGWILLEAYKISEGGLM